MKLIFLNYIYINDNIKYILINKNDIYFKKIFIQLLLLECFLLDFELSNFLKVYLINHD